MGVIMLNYILNKKNIKIFIITCLLFFSFYKLFIQDKNVKNKAVKTARIDTIINGNKPKVKSSKTFGPATNETQNRSINMTRNDVNRLNSNQNADVNYSNYDNRDYEGLSDLLNSDEYDSDSNNIGLADDYFNESELPDYDEISDEDQTSVDDKEENDEETNVLGNVSRNRQNIYAKDHKRKALNKYVTDKAKKVYLKMEQDRAQKQLVETLNKTTKEALVSALF